MKKKRMETDEKLKLYKAYAIYSALGLGAAAGLFFGARYYIRRGQKAKSIDNSFDEGSPGNVARELKMAFDNDRIWGMGTDEEKVYQIFKNDIPSQKFFEAVQSEFKRQNDGLSLAAALTDELSSAEADEVSRIKKLKGLK